VKIKSRLKGKKYFKYLPTIGITSVGEKCTVRNVNKKQTYNISTENSEKDICKLPEAT
jgi:hypothetical protein